jgi:hypothetical protein
MTVLNKVYLVLGGAMIAFYALTAAMGWEFFAPEREVIPGEVRSSAGYRSPGFRGGK